MTAGGRALISPDHAPSCSASESADGCSGSTLLQNHTHTHTHTHTHKLSAALGINTSKTESQAP